MSTSASASSKMHFILIGVAVGCVLLAGTVFFVIRAMAQPRLDLSTAATSAILKYKLDYANSFNARNTPSNGITNLLQGWKINGTFGLRPDGKSFTQEDMLIQLVINPKYSAQRSQYLLNMKPQDFSRLIRTYIHSTSFKPDDVRTDDEKLNPSKMPFHTYTVQPMEAVDYSGGVQYRDHKYDPAKIAEFFHPTTDHLAESLIEVAGFPKGLESVLYEPWVGYPLFKSFGDDYVGVSDDGSIIALADGVGGAAGSELASKAIVEIAVELLSHHKASLRNYSWRLLSTMVNFLDMFNITGKATLVVAQIERNSLGGAKVTVLNVGDSGVAIVNSEGVAVARTSIGTHKDNTPFQLKSSVIHEPECAKLYEYNAPAHSRILVFSDGVADNLWPRFYATPKRAPEIAAYVAATVNRKVGPRKAPIGHQKKDDDVSIVVARV